MLKKEWALFSPARRDGHGETRERARAAASSQYICRESHRSATVKARVIALYALVLSNANHRRQNVRRAVAPRRIALVAGRRRSSSAVAFKLSISPAARDSSRYLLDSRLSSFESSILCVAAV